MRTKSPIVVALGGNAISRPEEEGNYAQQFANTRATSVHLADLIEAGCHLVITHGNGPQVGNLLRRVELSAEELYRLPLDCCVSLTQGGMEYMVAQCLQNELRQRGHERNVTALMTSVEVDPADPAFVNPTKPIGSFFTPERAAELMRDCGWQMTEIPQRGLRRVVPSPLPKRIIEIDIIRRLAAQGELLVVAGGGGIPVVRQPSGDYRGVEAVIDKDRTSALLAREIDAGTLVIGTNIERVAINYRKPNEQLLERLSLADARRHLADDQFPPGSMGPKIEAAIDFLEHARSDDPVVIICDCEHMPAALRGESGTWILRND